MVVHKLKNILKKKKEEKNKEKDKLKSFRESEELAKAENIKKEADRLAQLRQYQTAIEEYHRSLEFYPYKDEIDTFKNATEFIFKILYNIAACYSYLNKFDDAINYFDQALKIDIENEEIKVKALMGKGDGYYKKIMFLEGYYKGSRAYKIIMEKGWEKEIEKKMQKLKDSDKLKLLITAHGCYTESTVLDRNNANAWYKKGHMEILMNRVKDAMLSFDKVINLNKDYKNREGIALFDEMKREKGMKVELPELEEERLFKTKSGHLVRNETEKMIADFLFDNNLMFQYNTTVSWSSKDNFKSSFYIPKLDLYIEHFGYDDVEAYKKLMKWKIKQFEKNKKRLVYTTSQDERNIDEVLKLKLKPYIIL